jgi:hypothetical protein
MKIVGCIVAVGFALSIAAFGPRAASAETKLSDFNGTWHGGGTDRNTPFDPAQRTSCRATIKADLRTMSATISCNGVAGLDKLINLNINLAGDVFTGTLTQKATVRGAPPSVLNGTVSGTKTDTSANFRVSFSGLTPSVAVTLKLNNPSSFYMHAETLGGELMNIAFNRTGK